MGFQSLFVVSLAALFCFLPVLRLLDLAIFSRTGYLWVNYVIVIFNAILLIFFDLLFIMGNMESVLVLVAINIFWWLQPSLSEYLKHQQMRTSEEAEIIRLQHLIIEDPRNAIYHSALADIYLARERFTEAQLELQHVIKLLPPECSREEQYKLSSVTKRLNEMLVNRKQY